MTKTKAQYWIRSDYRKLLAPPRFHYHLSQGELLFYLERHRRIYSHLPIVPLVLLTENQTLILRERGNKDPGRAMLDALV